MVNGPRKASIGLSGMTVAKLSTPLAIAKPLEKSSSFMTTRYLDHDHKDMKAAIVEACAGVTTDREKAIGIFNFARDRN
jgi:hypothetical protein